MLSKLLNLAVLQINDELLHLVQHFVAAHPLQTCPFEVRLQGTGVRHVQTNHQRIPQQICCKVPSTLHTIAQPLAGNVLATRSLLTKAAMTSAPL